MRSILNSRFDELAALSEACRQRVAEHFTWEAKARKVVALYETVLAGRPVHPMAVHHVLGERSVRTRARAPVHSPG